jgi:hypothetical protein
MKSKSGDRKNSNSELTVEKLRGYKGFENISEEEAQIHIENIKRYARILLGKYRNDNPS